MEIDISGLDKAEVLAALYNAARPQGMGFAQYTPEPMSFAEAQELLGQTRRFDYVRGRVMKIDFEEGDVLDVGLYDRDNGEGAAHMVINSLRQGLGTDNDVTRRIHQYSTTASIQETREVLTEDPRPVRVEGGMAVVSISLNDFAELLGQKIDEAEQALNQ